MERECIYIYVYVCLWRQDVEQQYIYIYIYIYILVYISNRGVPCIALILRILSASNWRVAPLRERERERERERGRDERAFCTFSRLLAPLCYDRAMHLWIGYSQNTSHSKTTCIIPKIKQFGARHDMNTFQNKTCTAIDGVHDNRLNTIVYSLTCLYQG